MIKKEDKRGSHVGVMISFIIFVTFLLFIYAIVQPVVISKKEKKAVLYFLESQIKERITYEMTTGTVNLITPVNQNCVELNGIRTELEMGDNMAATNYAGQGLTLYVSSSDTTDVKIQRRTTSDNLLRISYSEAFDELGTSSVSCVSLSKGSGYELGVTETKSYIFETELEKLIDEYEDYPTLKSALELPEGVDFGFGMILSDGSEMSTNGETPSTDIYILENPILYVSGEGEVLVGYLKTKIW